MVFLKWLEFYYSQMEKTNAEFITEKRKIQAENFQKSDAESKRTFGIFFLIIDLAD